MFFLSWALKCSVLAQCGESRSLSLISDLQARMDLFHLFKTHFSLSWQVLFIFGPSVHLSACKHGRKKLSAIPEVFIIWGQFFYCAFQ